MKKILLIDDDILSIEFIKIFLESEGFIVTSCDNFADAIRNLDRELPDVLITDLQLGDSSGMDIVAYVQGKNPTIRTIVISGFNPVTDDSSNQTRPDFHLTKPVDLEIILQAILTK